MLALYRTLIPAHASIPDATVEVHLGLAAQAHTASVWGQVYPQAMVWYAAHTIERTPGLGSASADGAGPITSKRAGDVAVTYSTPTHRASDGDLGATSYGRRYLELRASRAALAPRVVLA